MNEELAQGNGSDEAREQQEMLEDLEFELDTQSQIFLELRGQNIELMKIAAEIAGYGGSHPPLKPHDVRHALKAVLDVYAELYTWVDPEEAEEDEGEDEEE